MKNLRMKYTSMAAVCLSLLALLPASCNKDDYAAKEKATVQVTFMTRAIIGSSTTAADALETYEHMRTLRVIVARVSDSDILYNVKYNIEEGETSKTITFSELTIEKEGELFDFYAIANENGVGYTDNWDDITVDNLKKISLTDKALDNLNKGNTYYIPQTAHARIEVGEATDDVTIPLQFAVAKVRLTIENTSTDSQTVSDISLSGLNTTSTPLFAETMSDVTTGFVSLGTMDIPVETSGTPGKSTVYAYFFENTGGEYKLNAKWGELENTFDIKALGQLSGIKRGTELDITITIKKNVTTPKDFFIQVNSWDSADMDIPSFE